MESKNSVIIDHSDISRIKDFAVSAFREFKGMNDMNKEDIQALLIAEGIHRFLKAQGIEPNFKVKL